jgi:hypothetical protein
MILFALELILAELVALGGSPPPKGSPKSPTESSPESPTESPEKI